MKATRLAPTSPANDSEARVPERETLCEPQTHGLIRLGEVLPTVLANVLAAIETDLDYESCPHCHRPSWAHVEWLIKSARRDERERIALEERLAGVELSQRDRLANLAIADRLLRPEAQGRRLVIGSC